MKTEQILDKLWKWRLLLLIVYAITASCLAIVMIPPETPLRDLMISLNVLFTPIWIELILWYRKTGFIDLLEEV